MLDDRNIQLGCGFQTVEGKGVAVVARVPKDQPFIPEEQFTFRAKLCDTYEDLQNHFSAAMSVSMSAYGADLGARVDAGKTSSFSGFDSYYMMELEFRRSKSTLTSTEENPEILDCGVKQELETLDTLEKWEEFYRTKGDHVVNSVTYGHKLIIIVSLSHKIRSQQLRRMVEAKNGFIVPGHPVSGEINAHLEVSLSALAEENISSVQIYSIGDSKPNFLNEIDKLALLKKKIKSFVNATPISAPDQEQASLKPDASENLSEKGNGVIIAYSTCSYIDFLNKKTKNIKMIEAAYDKLLQQTSRAALYLGEITRCYGRVNVLKNSLDFFISGHDGAFGMNAPTEAAANIMQNVLARYSSRLRSVAREIVAEVSGLSEDGRIRRLSVTTAKECLDLLDDSAPEFLDDLEHFQPTLVVRAQLIDRFHEMISAKGGDALSLKQRLNDFSAFLIQIKEQKNTLSQAVRRLSLNFLRTLRQVSAERSGFGEVFEYAQEILQVDDVQMRLEHMIHETESMTSQDSQRNRNQALGLKEQWEQQFLENSERYLTLLSQYQLTSEERVFLQKICNDYIQEMTLKASASEWWSSRWSKIVEVSRDLDLIAQNKKPRNVHGERPIEVNILFDAIDFEFGAFLVGVLDAKPNIYWNTHLFNGSRHQNMKIPNETLYLRFKVEGDLQFKFHVASESKRFFEGREGAHRKLYRSITTNDRVYPVRPHMREVARLLDTGDRAAALAQGDELMHASNETTLHKKIIIQDGEIISGSWAGGSIHVRVFAQMKPRIDPLDLPDEPPIGRADYGVRMGCLTGGTDFSGRAQQFNTRNYISPRFRTSSMGAPLQSNSLTPSRNYNMLHASASSRCTTPQSTTSKQEETSTSLATAVRQVQSKSAAPSLSTLSRDLETLRHQKNDLAARIIQKKYRLFSKKTHAVTQELEVAADVDSQTSEVNRLIG